MQEQIHLTPYNQDKTLRPIIDGAGTEGVGFVLFQWIDKMDPSKGTVIRNDNCSRLKESQLIFSPIPAESISLDFSISSCSFWLLSKSLCDIENKRLQKIISRAQKLKFVPNHIAGNNNEITDALSRLCRVISKTEHTPDDIIRLLPMSKKAK